MKFHTLTLHTEIQKPETLVRLWKLKFPNLNHPDAQWYLFLCADAFLISRDQRNNTIWEESIDLLTTANHFISTSKIKPS